MLQLAVGSRDELALACGWQGLGKVAVCSGSGLLPPSPQPGVSFLGGQRLPPRPLGLPLACETHTSSSVLGEQLLPHSRGLFSREETWKREVGGDKPVSSIALGLRVVTRSSSLLFSAHSRMFWPSDGFYACFQAYVVHSQTSVPRGLCPGHHIPLRTREPWSPRPSGHGSCICPLTVTVLLHCAGDGKC